MFQFRVSMHLGRIFRNGLQVLRDMSPAWTGKEDLVRIIKEVKKTGVST